MNINLENHPIWEDFEGIFAQIDVKGLVMTHLASCNYKVSGYWAGDEFYEEIAFVGPLRAEFVNRSIGQTQINGHRHRWVRLQFALKPDTSDPETADEDETVAELTLVLDPSWKIVDENWLIDVDSPSVVARKKT